MPLKEYFKGHGTEVMKSIRKAHPEASEERVKEEFYRTANARKMKPRKASRSKARSNNR